MKQNWSTQLIIKFKNNYHNAFVEFTKFIQKDFEADTIPNGEENSKLVWYFNIRVQMEITLHITYNAVEMQSGQKQINGHHQQTTAGEEKVGKL